MDGWSVPHKAVPKEQPSAQNRTRQSYGALSSDGRERLARVLQWRSNLLLAPQKANRHTDRHGRSRVGVVDGSGNFVEAHDNENASWPRQVAKSLKRAAKG